MFDSLLGGIAGVVLGEWAIAASGSMLHSVTTNSANYGFRLDCSLDWRVFSYALTAAVLAGGLYAGFELRKRRLGTPRNPYRAYERDKGRDTETGTDYGAVGI